LQWSLHLAAGTLRRCRWTFLCYALLFVAIPPIRYHLVKSSNEARSSRNALRKAAAQKLYPQVLDEDVRDRIEFSRLCGARLAEEVQRQSGSGLEGARANYETVTREQQQEVRLFLKAMQSRDL